MMMSSLIVFAAGYVLGSKAGRERYNQIVSIAQEAARRLDEYGARDWFPPDSSRDRSRDSFLVSTRSGGRYRRR